MRFRLVPLSVTGRVTDEQFPFSAGSRGEALAALLDLLRPGARCEVHVLVDGRWLNVCWAAGPRDQAETDRLDEQLGTLWARAEAFCRMYQRVTPARP